MRYFDKHTIKNNAKWQEKNQSSTISDDWNSFYKNQDRKTKVKVKEFSYFVEDKIWWNSLTYTDQINVYIDQLHSLKGYKESIEEKDRYKITNEWYREWLSIKLKKLKLIYHPQKDVKRNLVIEEILK
jgi:hypothetical protein